MNVCLGGDLCSPFFSNVSEIPCVQIGFNVNDFIRMTNESRFPECGRFHFLLSSETLLLLAGTAVVNIAPQRVVFPWESDRYACRIFRV